MSKFLTKKKIILILVAAVLCMGIAALSNAFLQKQNGKKLDALLSDMSFAVEDNDFELDRMREFSNQLDGLSNRDAARYYRTLTKLYMLRDDSDQALLTFVDAQIKAEISKAYDVEAWLFADITQVYIDFNTYDIAIECMDTALRYAAEQRMEPFFYEYCYVTLAELHSREGNLEKARAYYDKSINMDSPDLPEYQSMEMKRHLVMANIAQAEEDYDTSVSHLDAIKENLASLEYPPIDVLWASGIYYPYLEQQTKLALSQRDYERALAFMDDMFIAGNIYGQTESLLSFLSNIIAVFKDVDINTMPPELRGVVENYMQNLILEYPEAFLQKDKLAGTHVYNSNMAMAAAFVQNYDVKHFYKLVAEIAIAAAVMFVLLIFGWQKSEHQSRIDGLTGAFNRKFYIKSIENLEKSGRPFGLIMYDIDFFKQINDGFGHEAGDAVLRDVSKSAMQILGHSAKLFRYGGDEFCILSSSMNIEQMTALAESIRRRAEQLRWSEYEGMKTTLSMGVAHSSGGENVKACVDQNLYRSKEAGRNRVTY